MSIGTKKKVLNSIIIGTSVLILGHLRKRIKKIKNRRSQRVNPYLMDRNVKGRFATDVSDH